MKAKPIRVTTPYPSLQKMARTLGASKSEIKEAKSLVEKVVFRKKAVTHRQAAKRAAV